MRIYYSGWWNIFKSEIWAHKLSRNVSSTVETWSVGLYQVIKGEESLLNPLGVFVHIWSISFPFSTRQTLLYRSVQPSSIRFRIFSITKLIGFWKSRNLNPKFFVLPNLLWRKFWLYGDHPYFERSKNYLDFHQTYFWGWILYFLHCGIVLPHLPLWQCHLDRSRLTMALDGMILWNCS